LFRNGGDSLPYKNRQSLSITLLPSSQHSHILSLLLVLTLGEYCAISGLTITHTRSTLIQLRDMSTPNHKSIIQTYGNISASGGETISLGNSVNGVPVPDTYTSVQTNQRRAAEEAESAKPGVWDRLSSRLGGAQSAPSQGASRDRETSQKASAASCVPYVRSVGNRLYGEGRVPAHKNDNGVITAIGESRPGDAKLMGRMLPDGTCVTVSLNLVLVVDNRKPSTKPLSPLGRTGPARWALNKEIDA
jgi:hypothetical protein